MNMAASVAEASADGNYKALLMCHYKHLAKMPCVALQLVDPSRLRAALMRQKAAEVSNLGSKAHQGAAGAWRVDEWGFFNMVV
jgi:hypothetical protein